MNQYDSITGDISFDKNGDNAGQRIFSLYQACAMICVGYRSRSK
jgi:hypothetical protein